MKWRQTEHNDQVALFKWAAARSAYLPELKLLFAIPNGGLRNIVVAKRMKAEGVRRGVPDILLPVPRSERSGLFIEMKSRGEKPTPDQQAWSKALLDQGYSVVLCYGWEDARNELLKYLGVMA